VGLTPKQLRDAQWRVAFSYDGGGYAINTYTSDEIEDFSVTHETRAGKTKIIYACYGKKFHGSPGEACRFYNEERRRRTGRRGAAGSAEQVKTAKTDRLRHGNVGA
jgi:hypothetical protein